MPAEPSPLFLFPAAAFAADQINVPHPIRVPITHAIFSNPVRKSPIPHMTSWKAQMRAEAASHRRAEREAVKRQRELEKLAKERAKLDAIEQARLEVAEAENRIEVLLSVHKDCASPTDWLAAATELEPAPPLKTSAYELRARQTMLILPPDQRYGWEEKIEIARLQDEQAYQAAVEEHKHAAHAWEKRVTLARKIRRRDMAAYGEAIHNLSPLGEITHLGSSSEITLHTPRLLECNLALNSSNSVPSEIKTLTASNKVSTKAMPTGRLHEIYQDYLCSCIIRVARELFALLPIETLLVTARTHIMDPRTGQRGEHPVLSVAVSRGELAGVNFENIDPSDTIESFTHRGDFRASRKSGAFLPIEPLTAADILPRSTTSFGLPDLLKQAESLRSTITTQLAQIRAQTAASS